MKEWINQKTISENLKTYSNEDKAFRALIGGIGTGNFSLDQDGRMVDFEIFNKANKGHKIPYSFFALYTKFEEASPRCFILEARYDQVSNRAKGHPSGELMSMPRFDQAKITPKYPHYHYEFYKEDLPLEVSLEAYNPFIPLDDKNSGIPMGEFRYKIKNLSQQKVTISVCGTMNNATNIYHSDGYDQYYQYGQGVNTLIEQGGITGIHFTNDCSQEQREKVEYGSLALATTNKNVTVKPVWQFGDWCDGAEEFWQDFSADGLLNPDTTYDSVGSKEYAALHDRYIGSIAAHEELAPGEEGEFTFYFTWHFPNRFGWFPDGHKGMETRENKGTFKNYYTKFWKDAWDVINYYQEQKSYLKEKTLDFSNAIYSSNLGANVIESLVQSINVLRSPTCFRVEDGKFFGWEGCFEEAGCCPGSCTHVWNYAQTAAYLFPVLEQDARLTEFLEETDCCGDMAFRATRYLDGEKWGGHPAADGQMGSILRVYREYKISGNSEFLNTIWEQVVSSMEFGIRTWDTDEDGLMEKMQHNTYDIEFYGYTSLANAIYLAALKAMMEMAKIKGQTELVERYERIYQSGRKLVDEALFNGEYYQQKISDEDLEKYRYQYGTGCLSDQLLGQTLAHIYDLGYVLPEEHVKRAVLSIYKYNYKEALYGHYSVQRTYAFEDEGGLLVCSWPRGGRPRQPFIYCDEVFTGIEYHVATHMIYEGLIEEALKIMDTVRVRHNGRRRSPFNEIECGNHYVRSMSAWGVLIALSGYKCDLSKNYVFFEPKINQDDFTCFYSNGKEWGLLLQKKNDHGSIEKEILPIFKIEE